MAVVGKAVGDLDFGPRRAKSDNGAAAEEQEEVGEEREDEEEAWRTGSVRPVTHTA